MDEKVRVFLALSAFMLLLVCVFSPSLAAARTKRRVRKLARRAKEITPGDLFRLRKACMGSRGRKSVLEKSNFAGVYILTNYTKKKTYVGQAQKILDRANQHFAGYGNGDVYADYRYGDRFTIRMIALKGSGFRTLNDLERHAIRTFSAFNKGYNRTRGNQ